MQKQRKKTQKERKKKEREEEEEMEISSSWHRPRATDPGRRPRPCATRSRRDRSLCRRPGSGAAWVLSWSPSSSSSSSSSLSFFFLSFCVFFRCFCILGYILALMIYFWVRNRVSKTRFPCRRHLEKVPRKRQTTHENRALKTRFRSPKSSL